MGKSQMIVVAVIIAIGLYLSGWALGHAIIEVKNKDRVVSVKGLAEKRFRLIWLYGH